MKVRQKRLLWAGILVLALTNTVALLGIAHNRKSPPDSMLTLSERELRPEWSRMWWGSENSGLSTQLLLRTELARDRRLSEPEEWATYSTYGGFESVRWLDQDKLAALGFDAGMPPTAADGERHYDHMLGREVLLVLELDGPTYAQALRDVRDRLAHWEQQTAAQPEDKRARQQLETARTDLQGEEHQRSRLFIIDAGLDEDSLRQRYPDRSHYAIVRGTVRPVVSNDGTTARLYGRVTTIHCESINVPLQFRAAIPGGSTRIGRPVLPLAANKQSWTVQLAFGRRFEPWIVSARAGP